MTIHPSAAPQTQGKTDPFRHNLLIQANTWRSVALPLLIRVRVAPTNSSNLRCCSSQFTLCATRRSARSWIAPASPSRNSSRSWIAGAKFRRFNTCVTRARDTPPNRANSA